MLLHGAHAVLQGSDCYNRVVHWSCLQTCVAVLQDSARPASDGYGYNLRFVMYCATVH